MKKRLFALFGLLAIAGGIYFSSFYQAENAQAAICNFDTDGVCCIADGSKCYCLPDNNLKFE